MYFLLPIRILVFTLIFAVIVVLSPSAEAGWFGDFFGGKSKPKTSSTVQSPSPKLKPTPKPSPIAKPAKKPAQVKGAKDKKGDSILGKIGKMFAAVGDFLWPFDGKGKATATNNKVEAKLTSASAAPAASPAPNQGEDSLQVKQASPSDGTTVQYIYPETLSKLEVTGDTKLGDGSSDRIDFKGLMKSDILVGDNKAYNIGSGSGRFKSGYFSDNIYIGEENRLGADGMNVKGSMYLNTRSGGSIYLDADSGTVYLGEGTNTLSNSDNNTNLLIDPSGSGRVNFHSGSNYIDANGNLVIAGTVSSSGAGSSDSIDITPATDIDALDITGTNIATADLIDLDATATTTGDAIDISMANTRTSGSAILIADASIAATVTGDLVQVNVTGTKDTNTLDIDVSGAAAASGNELDITYSASAHTGNAIDLNMGTNVGGDAINIATAATTGNAIDITTSGVFANELIDINLGAQASTGDVINIAMGATAVDAQALVVANSASARTASMIQVDDNNSTGTVATFDLNVASTRGGLFDIDTTGAFGTENLIDITTGAQAWTSNILDINVGAAAATGDVVNIAMGAAAVDAQALVITNAAGVRTANMIQVDDNNSTGTVATFDLNLASTRGGLFDIDTTGAFGTENLIDITTGAQAWTSNILDFNFGDAAATGDVININNPALAVATQAIVVDNAAAASTEGWLLEANASGIYTGNAVDLDLTGGGSGNAIDITTATTASSGNLIDLNFGNIADTGDAINISMGAAAVGAQGLVLGTSAGIRTASAIAITENNTTGVVPTIQYDSAQTRGGILDANLTGAFGTENAIDIDTTADFTSNIIDITAGDGGVGSTGNLIDLNFSSTAHTGDAINISMLTNAVGAQALVITTANAPHTASAIEINDNNSTGTVATFDLNVASTRGGLFDIDTTGAFGTENLIDITTGAQAWTSNILDINVGAAAATGDVVNIAMGAAAVDAQALVITNAAGVRTANMIQVDDNNSTGTVATFDLNIASTRGGLFDIDTSGAFGTEHLIDITTGAQAWTSNILDINVGAAAATGDIINIALGASAPAAQALVVTGSSSTATGGVISLAVDTTAGQSADIIDITTTSGIMDGSDVLQGIDVNITGANHTGSNTINGIAVDLTTPDAEATEIGLNVGDNWDLGISSTSGIGIGAQKTLTADSATPSVLATSHAITANVNPTLYSNFTGGTAGQLLVIEVNDAVSTFDCAGSEATMNCGAADIAAAAGDILTWVFDGTIWNLVNWLDEGDTQTGADLAEYFGSHEVLEAGDVVISDVNNPEYVARSTTPYDSKLLGVVSTLPGLVMGDPKDLNQIALIGRVPVKATNENGAIKAGDYLTSSATKAGYAMKATRPGTVVGMALADFNETDGKVMTFIKATWYDPIEDQKRAVLAALGLTSGTVLGVSTTAEQVDQGGAETATATLVGPAPDGSLGVLAEEVDLLVHGLLTTTNLKVTTAAEFSGTLVVKGLATFEGDLIVKGAFSTGSLDLSGALTRTMTAASNLSAGDPVVVTGANTVARAGSATANVIGLVASDAAAGSQVKVAVAGTVGGYSGLAVGSGYYLGEGGVVTTSPGGTRAVHIGVAVSSNEMIVQIYEGPVEETTVTPSVATVDSGPTINTEPSNNSSEENSQPQSTPEPSPTATPEPSPSPSAEPSSTPVPSSTPEPSPSASPSL